ncbi:MAG: FecR domain-containing protein [Myxococcota bacterium]
MNLSPRDLDRGDLVEPDNLDDRLLANWEAIGERESKERQRGPLLIAAAVALAIGGGFLWAHAGETEGTQWASDALVTDGERVERSLPDGSTIAAEPGTDLRRELQSGSEVRLRLRQGEVRFEVMPNPQRAFVVWAGELEVRVVGTRFWVHRDGDSVEVRVERGSVDVRDGTQVERLRAGDARWFSREVAQVVPRVDPGNELPEAPEGALDEPPVETQEESRPPSVERPRPGVGELFQAARTARAERNHAEAVRLYRELARRFPRDTRAGLAALEAGRLQMDELEDFRGAVASFRLAIRRAPRSPLREDAMARIVRAYARLGSEQQCQRAKEAYLDRYPEGRHATDIRRRCPR